MDERRRYIRLNSCFPVEFSLYSTPKEQVSEEYQGFTCNVSEGGLCVNVRNLKEHDIQLILQRKVYLRLAINIPLFAKPAKAFAKIAWSRRDESDPSGKSYLIGLAYQEIKPEDGARILHYARRLKWMPRIIAAVLLLFFFGLLGLSLHNVKTRKENERLVDELVSVLEVKSVIVRELNELKKAKEELQLKLLTGKGRIEGLKGEITGVETRTDAEKARLKELQLRLDKLQKENDSFKQKFEQTEKGEISLQEQLARLRAESGELEQASIDRMLQWVKVHQIKRTGLVLSYEGDKSLKDWGFTYDQALACQLFSISGDKDRAEAILDFYTKRAERINELFYNAYDVKSGSPCEYTIHSGPNIWIAIAVCQYAKRLDDKRYLALAEAIANRMIQLQNESADGSIRGGPDVEWVSTEHNLDAYALFAMLDTLTGKQKYKKAASLTFEWLKGAGYNRPEGRFERGKGDATIATDTFSWGVAAIGPERLLANGMNPDGIMEFAEEECRVSTDFYRPDGRAINVVGFDFAKAQNLGRGGIVSTEWTAQMIVAFKIMADYYRAQNKPEKERVYRLKAEYYLTQLGKMVISSPSPTGQGEGCLPYASMDNVDTGHGWRVAKGRRTGSVAATIYYIFAYRNYNPLSF